MRSRLAGGFLAMLLAASVPLLGQPPQPAPANHAGPGGRSTGDVDALVKNFQFAELAQAVAAMAPSADRDYFAGLLANRDGRVADSVPLLEGVLATLTTSNPARAAVALRSLADDYVKLYRYNDAAGAFDRLLHGFGSRLDKTERRGAEDDYGTVRLLKDVPPQTVSFEGPIDLPTHRNGTLDTIDADLVVNGVEESWILDTGANFTAITASFARRLGVPVSTGKAHTQGITGAENDLRAAVLPELKIGGATVRNVVLIVLNDDSFNVPTGTSRYQINAVLGYPVLQALQRITFTADGHLLAGPASPSAADGATLYMQQLMPLLECGVAGKRVLFAFDTGANGSMFSVRYRREFASQLRGLSMRPHGMGGAGGVRKVMAYYLPHPRLDVGAVTVTLKDVPVVPELGTDTDKVFGNLGRDVTDPYRSFTIDFANMRFHLGEKR
jgi:hypothetical protein